MMLALAGASPSGGVWSGTGVSGNYFSTQQALVGDYSVVYTYSDPNGQCSSAKFLKITIHEKTVSASNGTNPLCGESTTLSIENITGHLYSWKKDGANISGAGNASLPVMSAGSYRVTVMPENEIPFTSTPVNITYPVTVAGTVVADQGSLCGYGSVNFSISGHTGTISKWQSRYKNGTGSWTGWTTFEETDNMTSVNFTLSTWSGGDRTHQIRAVVQEGSCSTKYPNTSAVIHPIPTVSAGSNLAGYRGGGEINLNMAGASPSGGEWSGTGVINDHFFDGGLFAKAYHLTYTYTDPTTQCVAANTTTVTIYNPTVSASNGFKQICEQETTTLSIADLSSTGHLYQWTKDGNSIPSASNASYTVTEPGSYAVRVTPESEVPFTPTATDVTYLITDEGTMTADQASLCGSGSVGFSISGNQGTIKSWQSRSKDGAGSWTAWTTFESTDDITSLNHSLTAATSVDRTYEVQAEVQNGGCETKYSMASVLVHPAPPTASAGAALTAYAGSGNITLNGTRESPSGGAWSDANGYISANVFDSNTASVNSHTLTYTYTDLVTMCQSTATKSITIVNTSVASSSGNTITLGQTSTLSVTEIANHTYQWKKIEIDGSDNIGTDQASYIANQPGTYGLTITTPNGNTIDVNNFTLTDPSLSQNQNYVRTRSYKIATTDPDNISDVNEVSESYAYFDGLGRPLQTVVTMGSPTMKDIIVPSEYDEFGRQIKEYLPLTTSSSSPGAYLGIWSGAQTTTYADLALGLSGETTLWSEKKLDNSPLNRVIRQAAPGDAWQMSSGKTVKIDYDVNTANEVRIWEVVANTPSSSGSYSAGELNKNTTTDEDDNQSITFTNKQGQTILKKVETGDAIYPWADTYYVYDIYGQLRAVFPPEGAKALEAETVPWTVTPAILSNWAFTYKYDARNRMVEKKVPGADPVYMVYDQWDRLVLTQDGKQRNSSPQKCLFTKYDVLNRPIQTGLMDYSEALKTTIETNSNPD
ncbi:MAG: hypothetical protein GY816_15415, partial [Cytophagales bacterium]|nr:hypothetical protein [Cytophagales bacterium]